MKVRFLVVGQGIAGTFVAKALADKEESFVVVDAYQPLTPSRIAGGAFNPLVFKRLTKSWMADKILPVMHRAVGELEDKTGTELLKRYPLYKIFSGEPDIQFWQERIEKAELADYADTIPSRDITDRMINMPYGAGKVNGAGRVLLKPMLAGFRAVLMEQGQLIEDNFDYGALEATSTGYNWKGIEAEHLIFCEGPSISQNPYFNFLPFKSTKGEVLTIEFTNEFPEVMINKRATIIPQTNGLYKFGSTYNWVDLDTEPTREALLELKLKLKNITTKAYEIKEHLASVRPTSNDRRPIIGAHPKYKNMWIFNGMGSKGMMLAPYFSEELIEHILKAKPLNEAVLVARFL